MSRHRTGDGERGGEETVRTTARGYDALRNPASDHCASQATDPAKHFYLWRPHHDNETLFYALTQAHLVEMLPVVDDPTVVEPIRVSARSTPGRAAYSCRWTRSTTPSRKVRNAHWSPQYRPVVANLASEGPA